MRLLEKTKGVLILNLSPAISEPDIIFPTYKDRKVPKGVTSSKVVTVKELA